MKRYVVLIASILIQACLGGVYAWSVFVPPLRSDYALTAGQAGSVFGVTIASFTLTMLFAGRIINTVGLKVVACTGAVLFGSGYVLASLSGGSFPILIVTIGLIGGAGIGFGYVCPLAACVKWFPKYKGLVTGIAVAGFGGGAIALSNVADVLFRNGYDVLDVFLWVGIIAGAIVFLSGLTLSIPGHYAIAQPEKDVSRIPFREKSFIALWLGMFAGTFGGLLVIGNLKPLALSQDIPLEYAGLAVSAFAIGNACGRIVWGLIYDRLGSSSIPASLVILGLSIPVLALAGSPYLFLLVATITGACFGACFVLYATDVSSIYGADKVGGIYPWIFLSYGVSGIAGPPIGGFFHDIYSSYIPAAMIAGAVAIAGAVLTVYLRRTPSPAVEIA